MATTALPAVGRTSIVFSFMMVPLALLTLTGSTLAMEELRHAAPHRLLLSGRTLLSRGLQRGEEVKVGDRCRPEGNNICPGTSSNNGTEVLQCCRSRCHNLVSDEKHCGACGVRCAFGELCCGGKCTKVAYDVNNCGECGIQCKVGQRCEYGTCGYA